MNKMRITLVSLLVFIFLAVIAVSGVVWKYGTSDAVPNGIIVGNIPLGGLPIDKSVAILSDYEKSLLKRTITIKAGEPASDSKSWTAAELGYRAEFGAAKEALLKLREGNAWTRVLYRYKLPKQFEISQSWSSDVFDAALRTQWGWIEKGEPQNASRTITTGDIVVYTSHKDAYRLDIRELTQQVNEWLFLDSESIGKELKGNLASFEAHLPLKVIHPEITLKKLKEEGIERLVMSFTTDFAFSDEGRAHNVTVTAESLNDWYLGPDEVFAYSELIAKAEKEHTYREAPVILNGKFVPGIGGGICQVSSTLYQAVLRAGLGIEQRRNHSLPVAYLPLGHDATYATDAIDFKFRNTTGKSLIIRTSVENKKLTIKLFGTMPNNESYEIESVTLDTIQPKTQQSVNPALPVGKTVIVDKGKPGYVVETFRTHLRDGKVVSRERVSKDTYRAQPTLIEIGPASPNATPSPQVTPTPSDSLVEDGL